MLENLKTFFFEPGAEQAREAAIVQAAAGKGHFFDLLYASRVTLRSADKCGRHSGMKPRGNARTY